MNWNPFRKLFEKKPKTGVYIRVTLDKHFQGITEQEPPVAEKPWIFVKGIDLAQAAKEIPGKSIHWHAVPMYIREKLELEPWSLEIEWTELRKWIQ